MRKVVVGLVVLVVLAVGVDRGADLVAESVAASSLQDSQGLTSKPDVSIGGFPFLTQLQSRDFDQIQVEARDVPLGNDLGLTLDRLDVTLLGATVSRDLTRFEVRRAEATAIVGYGELGDLLGVDLAVGANGRIRVSQEFDVFGQIVEPRITIRPRVVDGALAFAEPTVAGLREGVEFVTEQLSDVFGTPIALQGIPFDISLDAVGASRTGIRLELSGTDLTYVEK